MSKRCPNCGATMTGSTCEFCGDLEAAYGQTNSYERDLINTDNAFEIRSLEKEIKQHQQEIERINAGGRNGCMFFGWWIILAIAIFCIASLYINNWKEDMLLLLGVGSAVFVFLTIVICKLVDKSVNEDWDRDIRKEERKIAELQKKINQLKSN